MALPAAVTHQGSCSWGVCAVVIHTVVISKAEAAAVSGPEYAKQSVKAHMLNLAVVLPTVKHWKRHSGKSA